MGSILSIFISVTTLAREEVEEHSTNFLWSAHP
jgi:hypothetical protein